MDRYDAIIVGAGAAGLSAASYAAALDRHVLLLDCSNGASSDFAKSGGGPAAAGTRFQQQTDVTDSPEISARGHSSQNWKLFRQLNNPPGGQSGP